MKTANYEIRKPLVLSRGPAIDIERCVEAVGGNRFNLVLIASAKSREIRRHHASSEKREHVYANITALGEIEAGGVDADKYLSKVR